MSGMFSAADFELNFSRIALQHCISAGALYELVEKFNWLDNEIQTRYEVKIFKLNYLFFFIRVFVYTKFYWNVSELLLGVRDVIQTTIFGKRKFVFFAVVERKFV